MFIKLEMKRITVMLVVAFDLFQKAKIVLKYRYFKPCACTELMISAPFTLLKKLKGFERVAKIELEGW